MATNHLFQFFPPESRVMKFYRKHNAKIKIFSFALYYGVGIIFYSRYENYSIFHSVYFITVSCTSVGYGDHDATTENAKLFTAFYIIVGVTLVWALSIEFAQTVLLSFQDELIHRFNSLRGGSALSPSQLRKIRIYYSLFTLLFIMATGTAFYAGNEGWTFVDAFYWTVQTMTTVGYGDLHVVYESTKVFAVIFIYGSVLTFAVTFNNIIDYIAEVEKEDDILRKSRSICSNKFSSDWVDKVLGDGDQGCSKERFTLAVLTQMQVLNMKRDVRPLYKKFEELDIDNKGFLMREDLLHFRFEVEEMVEGAVELNPLHQV